MNLRRVKEMIRRSVATRGHYPRTRDWLLSLYNRVLQHKIGPWLPGNGRLARVYVKDFPQPFYVRVGTTDWLVLEEIYVHGEYDSLSDIQLENVRQIVDLGANVGFSVRLWRQKFPAAAVLAVEPDPDNAVILQQNCGGDPNVQIIQACVAASARTVQIDRSGGAWGVRMVEGSNNPTRIEVKALPLGEMLASKNFAGDIDLLKCDIEGAEAGVFANCAAWISRVRVLILEIHAPYSVAQWQKDVQAAGSELKIIRTVKSIPEVTVFLAAVPSVSPHQNH